MESDEVRAIRAALRMTQEVFAHALDVTVCSVNRWENGHARPSKLAQRSLAMLVEARLNMLPRITSSGSYDWTGLVEALPAEARPASA